MKKSTSLDSRSAAQLIDARIEELGDWRGPMLSRLRALTALVRAAVTLNTSTPR